MTRLPSTFSCLFFCCLIAAFFGPISSNAQQTGAAEEAPGDADSVAAPAWNVDAIGKISASQAGYRNWTKGGVNTVAGTTGIDVKAKRTSDAWEQTHDLRLAYGLVKQDTLEFRKADDEIRLNSAWKHTGSDDFFRHFNPTVAFQIRTQFTAGYNYKKNPFTEFVPEDLRKPPVKVSDFLSPVTVTQSVGLSYGPADWFSQRVGVGSKQTVVVIDRFRPIYGVERDDLMLVELGVESRTHLDREIWENVKLQSTLGLFAAFNKPDLPDLQWENLVAMKVNSWLGVNFEVDTLYDRDLSSKVQIKEVLSLGLSLVLI